jgi:hypothetical protein
VTKYSFPATYGTKCYLVPIDAALVPLVSGALNKFQEQYVWETREDWQQGYNAFAQLQGALVNNCLIDLVESNNRIYRLLDTALNGTQYTSSPNPADPERPLVEPAIPASPATVAPTSAAALRAQIARLWQLSENAATGFEVDVPAIDGGVTLDFDGSWRARLEAVQGLINEGWFGIGGEPATLADVVAALRIGTPQDAERIDTALEALSASSSAANVFGVVRGLLSDVVDTGLEGGVLGTLIAASIANAAQQGVLAGQIDRLIRALDGGGLNPPSTNVLGELGEVKTLLS